MDPEILTLLVAGAGALTSVLALLAGRRERRANANLSDSTATAQISGGYSRLMESQNALIAALESRVTALETEKDEIKVDFETQLEEKDKKIAALELKLETAIAERNAFALRLAKMETKVNGLTNGGGSQ